MNTTDSSLWAILLGGGSVLGVVVKQGFDYLKSRMRQSVGDRREVESGLGRLVKRLETRLNSTEEQAKTAREKAEQIGERLAECEHGHTECRTRLGMLTASMNELRLQVGLQLMADINDE